MALSLDTGTAQTTALTGTVSLYARDVNAYRAVSDVPGSTLFTNVNSSPDRTNTIRYAVEDIANIYKNSDVDAGARARIVSGRSMLCQVNETWRVTDSTDVLAVEYLPVSCHVVIKVPKHSLITDTLVADLLQRAVGAIAKNGATTLVSGVGYMLKGITNNGS